MALFTMIGGTVRLFGIDPAMSAIVTLTADPRTTTGDARRYGVMALCALGLTPRAFLTRCCQI